MDITLAQLRVIEAVARSGGIGRAAKELGVSQPSVSTTLNGFEGRYRVRLFSRNGHALRPTPLCEALLPRMRTLLSLAGEIERRLHDEEALTTGRLAVGYSTDQFVMPVLSRLLARHPGIRIEARAMASHDLMTLLRDGAIETAFVTVAAPDPDLEAVLVRREPVVLMAPAGHPIAREAPVGWHRLSGLPLVRREATSGTRRIFEEAARAAGARLRPVLELGSWASLRAAVIAGIGFGIAMRGEIGDDSEVVAVPIDDPSLVAHHCLVTLPSQRLLATVSALFEACAATGDGLPASSAAELVSKAGHKPHP
jgi:DNA-binding transcriptional LysR family regulator